MFASEQRDCRHETSPSCASPVLDQGAAAVVGDLSDLEETRGVAGQVNRLGRMDAVIHNAGVYTGRHILPVNIVAPYLLTALIDRPQRLVRLGHLTQEWLATSEDPDACTSGGYWHHQRRTEPHRSVRDRRFQEQLLEDLARFTATRLV